MGELLVGARPARPIRRNEAKRRGSRGRRRSVTLLHRAEECLYREIVDPESTIADGRSCAETLRLCIISIRPLRVKRFARRRFFFFTSRADSASPPLPMKTPSLA